MKRLFAVVFALFIFLAFALNSIADPKSSPNKDKNIKKSVNVGTSTKLPDVTKTKKNVTKQGAATRAEDDPIGTRK